MNKIILASGSPRRKELLESLGLDFEVIPSAYEEDNNLDMKPDELVSFLSENKAKDIAKKYPDDIVIGCDTLIAIDDQVIGKPKDSQDAKDIITKSSGTYHYVYTAHTIMQGYNTLTSVSENKVYIKDLTQEEIQAYINTKYWEGKAGGYGIQGLSGIFIDRIEGDYYAIVGLSISDLFEDLQEFGVNILTDK